MRVSNDWFPVRLVCVYWHLERPIMEIVQAVLFAILENGAGHSLCGLNVEPVAATRSTATPCNARLKHPARHGFETPARSHNSVDLAPIGV